MEILRRYLIETYLIPRGKSKGKKLSIVWATYSTIFKPWSVRNLLLVSAAKETVVGFLAVLAWTAKVWTMNAMGGRNNGYAVCKCVCYIVNNKFVITFCCSYSFRCQEKYFGKMIPTITQGWWKKRPFCESESNTPPHRGLHHVLSTLWRVLLTLREKNHSDMCTPIMREGAWGCLGVAGVTRLSHLGPVLSLIYADMHASMHIHAWCIRIRRVKRRSSYAYVSRGYVYDTSHILILAR